MKAIVARDRNGQVVWVRGNTKISRLSFDEFREVKDAKAPTSVAKNGHRFEAPFTIQEEEVSESLHGTWVREKIAKCWPTGSIVLIHRMDRPNTHHGAIEVCPHFRPDWVGIEDGYGDQPTEFMRLNR